MSAKAADPAPTPPPGVCVRPVDVELARPLRLKFLRPGVGEAGVTYKTDDEQSAEHLGAWRDDDLLGVVSFHLENRVAGVGPYGHPGLRARGLALDEASENARALAAMLLAAALEGAKRLGAAELWANVRLRQIPLFEASSLVAVSSEFDIPGLGAHRVLARPLT
ncbi:MAG: hypothetical protein AB7T63_17445 [Planctomycetota bacterium]